ncbi:MAG: hypothetical protein RLZZ244_2111 [Verrucomicrobiota bacterium]|jgi:hypothetical protein
MLPLRISIALASFWIITPHAEAALPIPSRVPSPAELDIPYSSDNPPGPQFTEEERRQQRRDGERIRSEILEAFHAGRDIYTIPPGDYRFDSKYLEVNEKSFAFRGLHASPSRPFRILGYGATLWFQLTDQSAPHYHQMVKLFDCSHLSLEGLTVDSDPRGCMDAKITAFDFEGNRIQVKPVEGTRLLQQMPLRENRFIPYKANGHHIASLYQIDSEWGPGNVFYERMERTEDGHYWFTLRTKKLLETIQNPRWRETYGPEGTLEVGDMLGVVYSTSSAITLLNCKQITVKDCRFHAAKAGIVEQHGYGGHHWIRCYLMARPGTNQLLGGDGVMSSCMHGSTFEERIVQRTTDDCFNSHGRWNHAESVGPRSITFRSATPPDLTQGHVAEAFDAADDSFVGTLTVETVDGKTVTFQEPVGERFAKTGVLFREFQNAGWAIRNSIFSDCYQRIRLMCGPGVFENNRVERVGHGLTLGSGKAVDPEGGLPHNVIIRNNLFIDSAVAPRLCSIEAKTKADPMRNLEISGNVICNSGSEALHVSWAKDLQLRDNILLYPAKGEALRPGIPKTMRRPAGIVLERIRGATVSGNTAFSDSPGLEVLQKSDSEAVQEEGNQVLQDAPHALEKRLRELTQRHDRGASEVIHEIRKALPGRASSPSTP